MTDSHNGLQNNHRNLLLSNLTLGPVFSDRVTFYRELLLARLHTV